jgi:LuxR family maltose regulon positive regulatory protein
VAAVRADGSPFRLFMHGLRGAASFDSGARVDGLDELHRARVQLGVHAPPPAVAAAVALLEQHCALQLGHTAEANGALAWLAATADAPAELALGRARSELRAGRAERARTHVAPVVAEITGDPVLPGTIVESWLVEAQGAFAAGERSSGRRALQSALATGESHDVVRPFAAVGRGVVEHLVDLVGGTSDRASFAARVLVTIRPVSRTQSRSVTLSPRERDVLTKLPSLDSLDQIATDLGVSVNTVKTHVRAIYLKLGVTGRRAAVLAAHDRGALV